MIKKTLTEIKSQLVLGWKVIGLVFEASFWWASFYLVTNLLGSVLPTVGLYIGKLSVDAVLAGDLPLVAFYALLGLGVYTLSSFFSSCSSYGYDVMKDILTKHVFIKTTDKAASLDLAYFDNAKFYDQLEKIQREIYYRPVQVMDIVIEGVSSVFGAISLSLLLFKLAWWAPVVLILLSVPRLFFRFKYSYYTYSITDSRTPQNRKIRQIDWLLTNKDAAAEVRVFNLKDYFLKIFNDLNDAFIQENKKLSQEQNAYNFWLDFLGNFSYYFLGFFSAYQTILGRLTLGDLTMLTGTIRQYQSVLQGIISYTARFYESNLFLQHYFSFLEWQPKVVNCASPKKIVSDGPLEIEFRNVSFGYEPDKLVLKGINLRIDKAKNFALVGENGAGKTTLIKLLLRLYDVTSGQILINGVDIREIDLEDLRKNLGVIFQDYMRYEMTVRENIGFGSINKIGNLEQIKKAARLSGAAEFIEKLPEKYETILGKYFEKGEELSGGQWQKIALARAFFSDARVLIMDEPTASLDPKSEYEVFKNLIAATKDKSLILISHRFSTVRLADEIIVLHDGKIVEQGNHDQLMMQGGRYAKLYRLQAKWYK